MSNLRITRPETSTVNSDQSAEELLEHAFQRLFESQSDNQTVELNNFSVSRAVLKLAVHLFQCIIPAYPAGYS